MKSSEQSMKGGLFVLASLVVMLSIPVAIGYYTRTVPMDPTLHADAAH